MINYLAQFGLSLITDYYSIHIYVFEQLIDFELLQNGGFQHELVKRLDNIAVRFIVERYLGFV